MIWNKDIKRPNYVFVDGMDEVTLSYNLRIIKGFCSQNAVSEVVVYKTQLRSIPLIDFASTSFSGLRVRNWTASDTLQIWMSNPWSILSFLARIGCLVLDAFGTDRPNLLDAGRWQKNPHRTAVQHGFWDALYKKYGIVTDQFSIKQRLSILNVFLRTAFRAEVISGGNCEAVFLGHNVYHMRVLADWANENKVPLYLSAAYTLQLMPDRYSPPPAMLTSATFNKLSKHVPLKEVLEAWDRRFDKSEIVKGGDIAKVIERAQKPKLNISELGDFIAVFAPVFCDSPFGWLDRDRPFPDYYAWITTTVRWAMRTKTRLLLRLHPSASAWGESSRDILMRMLGLDVLPEFIIIDDSDKYGHNDVLMAARQIVTFRGTVHCEAVALGVKPIVVSACMLSMLLMDAVQKPKDVNHYFMLLAGPRVSAAASFMLTAKKALYYKENCVGFRCLVGVPTIFRGDPKRLKAQIADRVTEFAEAKHEQFVAIGERLAKRVIDQTTTLEFK